MVQQSNTGDSADGDGIAVEREELGTAEELGTPVYEGVDPSDVTIYADGSHRGPVKRKYRTKPDGSFQTTKCNTDRQNYPVVGVYCPCGHYLRDKHLHHHEERQVVTCQGAMSVDSEEGSSASSRKRTEQMTLTEVA